MIILHCKSIPNLRDFGNTVTADGRRIRKDCLLRSAHLGNASEEDIRYLQREHRLRTVIDLRTGGEREEEPDRAGSCLVLNIPIMLAAYRLLGKRSFFYTLLSTALLSGFIELASFLPVYTGNILIAAVYGGVLTGIGIGILFLRNITTGGTDLLALMLHKAFPNVPNGTILAVIDGIVVLIAVLVFRKIEVALTSVLTIYFSSKVIDLIAQGVDYAKVIYIVTDKGKELSAVLNSSTDRGNTVIKAFGGYTGAEKQLVITVTRRNVLAQTLRLIHATDPAAFTFVTDSTEVHGEGFKIDYN